MAVRRRTTTSALNQLQSLLSDDRIPVEAINVRYKDDAAHKEAPGDNNPLRFQWLRGRQTEPLFFGFYTWGTAESQRYPDTFLALGTSADLRIVGFPLYLLPTLTAHASLRGRAARALLA